eukprot:c16127_g1_i1 orf=60-1568(+)
MVKTRSSTVSASSSSAQKTPCSSSSSLAPRKNKRRRTVSMPERKKKLRRHKALQKQIAIAEASQPLVTEETGKRNPKLKLNSASKNPSLSSNARHNSDTNHRAACKKFTKKELDSDKIASPAATLSRKTPRKRAAATVEEVIGEGNPKPLQRKRNSNGKGQHDTFLEASCKNFRISESAEACTGERTSDQVLKVNHDKGWTSEQDEALQNAYFQVRPSSNFWFEVSKKLLGKTAKDCFDRFYSAHPTPPTTQPRSRKLVAESPVRTISFPSPMPSLKCKARFGRGKQGLLKAHQTVRHILRQQRVADGTYEADVFSAVEQLNSRNCALQDSTNRAMTPLPVFKGRDNSESLTATPVNCFGDAKGDSELWWSGSSKSKPQSGHDQNQYSTMSSIQSQLLSPEVLKAERNPGRLDRFLDILHLRRVEKRKTSSLKGIPQKSCTVEDSLKSERSFTQCIAAAREAIISDAKEVLRTAVQQKSTVEEETSFSSDHLEEELSDNEIL